MKRIIASILMIGFLVYSSPIHAQEKSQKIEVYHIEEKRVIKEIPLTAAIQSEAEKYVSHISGIYKKINPIPKKGLIVRIPLKPPIDVQNQWIHTLADEINIFFPLEEDPYMMMYDDENNIYFFTIDQDNLDFNRLLDLLGLEA